MTIERFCFISKEAWETVSSAFPNPVEYSGAIVVNYDSPTQSAAMMQLVNESNYELVHHSKVTPEIIIAAIESGIDKLYNCDRDCAVKVCAHFTRGILNEH